MTNVSGYVLPKGTLPHSSDVVFPGFPGVWREGVSVATADLGISQREADELVKSLELPLKKVSDAKASPTPLVPGAVNQDVPSGTHDMKPVEEMSPMPGLTRAEFDERLAWETKREKQGGQPVSSVLQSMADAEARAPVAEATSDAKADN